MQGIHNCNARMHRYTPRLAFNQGTNPRLPRETNQNDPEAQIHYIYLAKSRALNYQNESHETVPVSLPTMKAKLTKDQWIQIGNRAGWLPKTAQRQISIEELEGNPTSRTLSLALASYNPVEVRAAAAAHPNATTEVLMTALRHERDPRVRSAAVSNPNANDTVLQFALSDDINRYPDIVAAVLNHPNANTDEFTAFLQEGSPEFVDRVLPSLNSEAKEYLREAREILGLGPSLFDKIKRLFV